MTMSTETKLTILVDECVSRKTILFLQSLNCKTFTPKDLNLSGATNGTLLSLSVRERMVLLTEDQDFGDIIKFPTHTHCGVILLKVPFQDDENIGIILKDVLSKFGPKDFDKTLVVISSNKYRLRR